MMKYLYSLILASAIVLLAPGCNKTNDNLSIPPEQATFAGQSSGTYFVLTNNSSFKIPVGLTTVSSSDRTINVSVTSPTGAIQGTHYTLTSSSIVIPAGKAIDSIEVKANFAQYTSGRKDTLVFTFTEPGVKGSDFNNTYRLLVRGACAENDIVLSDFLGTYANTNELLGTGPYGPYTTTISAVNQTSATTGTITVTNIFDSGWDPLVFTLDWTDPANRKVTLVAQVAGGNSGDLFGAQYDGIPYAVRPVPGGLVYGTFSYCSQTISMKMNIGVSGVGYSPTLYTVNMAR